MPLEVGHFLAWVLFGTVGFYLIVLLPWWILLNIFTPKSVMEKYFKEPHFTLTETYMLKEFPGSFMRTIIFGTLLLWPKRGKKRQLENMRGNVPLWFDWNARAIVICGITGWLIMVVLIPLLYFVDPIS